MIKGPFFPPAIYFHRWQNKTCHLSNIKANHNETKKKTITGFEFCYEDVKLSCAVLPEVKAEKRIIGNNIIALMQQGGDREFGMCCRRAWWNGDGANTVVSDLGSPPSKPTMHAFMNT